MKEKLLLIVESFFVTVIPPLLIVATIIYGGTLAQMVFDATPLVAITNTILLIPLGIFSVIVFSLGLKSISMVLANLIPIQINGSTHYIDIDPAGSASAKMGGFLSILLTLLVLIVTIPLSLIIWLVQVVIIIFGFKDVEYNLDGAIKTSIIMIIMLAVSSLAWIPVIIENAVLSPQKYGLEVTSLEIGNAEWNGSKPCTIYYNLTNVERNDELWGDVIITSKNSDKEIVVNEISFIPLMMEAGDGQAYIYFYISQNDTEEYELLSQDFSNLKIVFAFEKRTKPNWIWESYIKNNKYSYNGKYKIVAKDFGLVNDNHSSNLSNNNSSNNLITTEEKYQTAIALFNNGQYEEAKIKFEQLGDYKQSAEYVLQCEDQLFYIQMEKDLQSVAGDKAILPDNYSLNLSSYTSNDYLYYNGDYYLGFLASFNVSALEMEAYLNRFDAKLKAHGYSMIGDGVYKKDNTIIQLGYFQGDDYFTYMAFLVK